MLNCQSALMTSKKPVADSAEPSSSKEAEEQKSGAAAPRKPATHPSTAIMVKEALKELDSRKGASSKAIQNHIKQKYPSVDLVRLKHLVRRALIKGLETGTLVRPAKSTVPTGATGMFRLPPKVKEAKPKTENVDPNVEKAPKGPKNAAKKPPKTGASKKDDSANEEAKSQEDSKPPKKSKKEKETATATSKVAPAKKPKAKKDAEMEDDDEGASTSDKAEAPKAGKTSQRKAAKAAGDALAAKAPGDAPAARATGKRGKKNAE